MSGNLTILARCHGRLEYLKIDKDAICERLKTVTVGDIDKHEPDDKGRRCWVVVMILDMPGESLPFYAKVALLLPDMVRATLVSFKLE